MPVSERGIMEPVPRPGDQCASKRRERDTVSDPGGRNRRGRPVVSKNAMAQAFGELAKTGIDATYKRARQRLAVEHARPMIPT